MSRLVLGSGPRAGQRVVVTVGEGRLESAVADDDAGVPAAV